jgi:asparagine synthase (glutamine-hydrolysing)
VTGDLAGVFGCVRAADPGGIARSLGAHGVEALRTDTLVLGYTPSVERSEGQPLVVVVGDIRNICWLADDLGVERDAPTAEILAQALDRRGEEVLSTLRGGFVVASWDSGARSGFLAVDQLGVGSLYTHESAGRVAFATEVRNLLPLLDSRPPPDQARVVQWLVEGALGRGCTLYEGVRRLEGGQLLRLRNDRWQRERYWKPRYAAPTRFQPAEAVAELRSSLARAVGGRISTKGPTGLLLSGGLDSSAVAAVACRVRGSEDLTAYSLVYPDHPESDESSFIDQLVAVLGVRSRRMIVRRTAILPAALEFQSHWDLPVVSPMLGYNVRLLRQAAREGVRVLLNGEGGDELFSCSPYLIADQLRSGNVAGAMALVRSLPGMGHAPSRTIALRLAREYGLRGAVPRRLHRVAGRVRSTRRRGPSWLNAAGSRLYADVRDPWVWKSLDGPRWWAYQCDLLTAWRERMGAHAFLQQRSRLAGVQTRHPLLDDLDLIELVLRIPPELSFHADLNRPLARAAVAGLVPDAIRLRPDKSELDALFVDSLEGDDWAIGTELFDAPTAEVYALARPDAVRSLLSRPRAQRTVAWAWDVWRLITTECWLRSQSDPALPGRLVERHGVVGRD